MAPDAAGENHAILLTAPHPSAIAVIRVAGPLAGRFCEQHLDKPLKPDRPVHCNVIDHNEVVDDIVAVRVNDTTIDLSAHGGVWVVQSILDLTTRFGFTRTAWHAVPHELLAETADAIKQQVMIDLPRAHTREAIAILLAQPAAWREMVERKDEADFRRALTDRSLEHLLNPPTVAIIGAPNVGKSTLANQLFARDHSITADLPGTTRDWVGERANLDGLIVTLVDTPGQRTTADPIEAAAIDRAKTVIGGADLVVIVLDATRAIDDAEAVLIDAYPSAIVVTNKCDMTAPREGTIRLSARSGAGVDVLRRAIRSRFGCEDLASRHPRCWTGMQRDTLKGLIDLHV